MHITAQYSAKASQIAERMTFCCDDFELLREDVAEMKEKKLLKFVSAESLPQKIPCHVLMHCHDIRFMHTVFFNPHFPLPPEAYEEPLLNKDLLDWSRRHG